MSKLVRLTLLSTALLFCHTVSADHFLGYKQVKLELDGDVAENPVNTAINYGYELDSWAADLSLVGEFSRTSHAGKTSQGEDLEFNADSAYVLWKTSRSLYVSLRGGIVHTETITAGSSVTKTGLMAGAGIGQVMGRTRLQVEYTLLAGEAEFIGVSLEFDL